LKVLRIGESVAILPPFRIDIRLSSESVRFAPLSSWSVLNGEIETRKVFGPASLSSSEEFCGGKVFEVLVVGNDVDHVRKSFEIRPKLLESDEDGEELIVINVIVELCGSHRLRVECNQMEEIIDGINLQEHCSNRIVRSVSFDNSRAVGMEMSENGQRVELSFKKLKCTLTSRGSSKINSFLGECHERLRN
jgi:hypothetical protein